MRDARCPRKREDGFRGGKCQFCKAPPVGITSRGRPATARSQAVIQVFWAVTRDARETSGPRTARVESPDEDPTRIVDPLVDIADHVEEGVLTPATLTGGGLPRLPEQGAFGIGGEVQSGIEVIFRHVSIEKVGWVAVAMDIAGASHVLAAIRVLRSCLSLAGEHPLALEAESFPRVRTSSFGSRVIQIPSWHLIWARRSKRANGALELETRRCGEGEEP